MKASSKPFHLNNRGVMHLPLLVFSMFAVLIGLSLWGLLHHWKDLMDTQLRLDHCTGEVALDLKSKIATVESANRQIKIIRGSIEVAMATAVPTAGATAETIPELQAALTAEVARQEFQRLSWIEKRVTWVASGCGTKGDLGIPLPSLSWERDPPDTIGEQALNLDLLPDHYRVEAIHLPRKSAAVIERTKNATLLQASNWRARWAPPRGFLGASFR
jgi:hypothetical protein